ncbi:MAG TPA: GyrI-like domain-containing protein [Steroidobacteraceae bacterium]|nr:GyrI-like domain-containing protein [Steroidobacteraceae bacterium]
MNTLTVIERPAQTVVGLQIRTKPQSPDIPALWPKFVARLDEIPGAAEPNVSYGVMEHGDRVLEYAAAISVTSAGKLPAGMVAIALPAGTYARWTCPLSGLGKCFGEIFNQHLPKSGYVQAMGPFFERYDEKFDPADPGSQVEIWIPVRRKTAG